MIINYLVVLMFDSALSILISRYGLDLMLRDSFEWRFFVFAPIPVVVSKKVLVDFFLNHEAIFLDYAHYLLNFFYC